MLAAAEDWQLDVEMEEEEEDATGIERKGKGDLLLFPLSG